MSFSLAPLLMHSDHVPAPARTALRAAHEAPPADRDRMLEHAARVLHRETDLDCSDVLELVGLPDDCGCD